MKVKAYVDGSFNEARGVYGGGIVLIGFPGSEAPVTSSISGSEDIFLAHRNITGELFATIRALAICDPVADIDEVEIYYDYQGIEYWITGKWKAKKLLSQLYIEYMQKYLKRFKLTFHKVTAHSGDYYNNLADKLARDATYSDA